MVRLEHKTALVTGGASGLGKAIAQRLAADGATVVITDIQAKLGTQVAAECGFVFLQQDVTDESRWSTVVREIEERFGFLHIAINNAGIVGPTDVVSPEDARLADWRMVFAVNVESVFLGCRVAIKAMRRAGHGAIVNVSSIAALMSTPYATAYGASKAAVRQLTQSVAQYCAQERLNIRCNSVHPGVVRTPLWDRHAEEQARKRGVQFDDVVAESKSRIPLGDFVSAEDVAAAVAFLVSDDARHVTGEQLIVDGGFIHCRTYSTAAAKATQGHQSVR